MEDQLEYNSIFDAIASSPEEAAEMKSESDVRIKARDEEHRGGNATNQEESRD